MKEIIESEASAYNKAKDEIYFDAYKKFENRKVDLLGGEDMEFKDTIKKTASQELKETVPYMVSEDYKPLVFSEAFYLATKGGGEFFGKVGSFEEGYEFDAVILNDEVLAHPQPLNLAERIERAVYLGLDEKNISYVVYDGNLCNLVYDIYYHFYIYESSDY